MSIPHKSHTEFYRTEIQTIAKSWRLFLSKQVSQLIAEKELFIGTITSYNESSGFFILKIRKDLVPRQFTSYFLGLIGQEAWDYGDNPFQWQFTYQEFRESEVDGLWGDRLGGDVEIVKCYYVDEAFAYFELSVPDEQIAIGFKMSLKEIGAPLVLITQSDPPLKYLENLHDFVEQNQNNPICTASIDYVIDDWQPTLVDNEEEISGEIEEWTCLSDVTVIQGPPGTGKSFNTANYCNALLNQNKSVCICSLANKALISIAEEEGIKTPAISGRVYKTNLSNDERVKLPYLTAFDGELPASGTLLLSTYYKLSEIAKNLLQQKLRFDVVIIEESSQAFLATIAMFSSISKKTVLVGDHMQLPPIVITSENRLLKIHERIFGVVNGMQTLAIAFEKNSYRLTKTRRLTPKAADQTGYFYDGTLLSTSKIKDEQLQSASLSQFYDTQGGASLIQLPVAHPRYNKSFVKSLIQKLVSTINQWGHYKIAVLTQTRALEVELTQILVGESKHCKDLVVSTVHKIQGVTVDYAIVYLPLTNVLHELNENFFNVATSRARRGTLIITYSTLDLQVGIKPNVMKFIRNCKMVPLTNLS